MTGAERLEAAIDHLMHAMVHISATSDADEVPHVWANNILNHLDQDARNMLKAQRALLGEPPLTLRDRDRVPVARRIAIHGTGKP